MMSGPKKNNRYGTPVQKLAPSANGARDQGPRLLPIPENKKITDGESSKRFLELAKVALAKKKSGPPAHHHKTKRSA
jgi:hypothetical protein